jgi:hypothetical protein
MEPTTLLPVISLLSLVGVEYGGWALLGFLTGRGQLGEFREQFFRAGHAHAGVLLVLSLVYFLYLGRTGYSTGVQWLAGLLLLGWGSWLSREASSSISPAGRRIEARWERWSREPAASSSRLR